VQTALAPLGYDLLVAENGTLALELARTESPDLLILDWVMPGQTGLEIVTELRKEGSEVPVILLTARGLSSDREIATAHGIENFVSKPFSPKTLVDLVQQKLAVLEGEPNAH